MKLREFALVLTLAATAISAGQASAADIMPLDSVKKGMHGYGVSVFEGSEAQRFDVEIMGILRNVGPGHDLILAKVDSEILRKTGVIAGMSGSPIYIDGKIVGALAYAWQFATEPIAGITPIEQMVRISDRKTHGGMSVANGASPRSAQAFLTTLVSGDSQALWRDFSSNTRRTPASSSLHGAGPIATPISFGSFDAATIDRFTPLIASDSLMPVAAGSSGNSASSSPTHKHFDAGDAIAAVLVDGDFSVSATGTVTYVRGNEVYGFGHPFLDIGEVAFPMARAEIVGVLPNLARSFKFANAGAVVGALRQDRFAGIMGMTGEEADMVPVSVELDEAGVITTHHFRIARHPMMFPLLLAMTTDSIVAETQKAAGERTVVLDADIEVAGAGKLHLREGWAGAQARESIPVYLGLVSQYLISNEFKSADIGAVTIRLSHDDQLRVARVTDATIRMPADGEINQGDDIVVSATLKPFRGKSFVENFTLSVPRDVPAGKSYVYLGGGGEMNRIEFSAVPPDPQSLEEVVGVIGRLHPSTNLSATIYSPMEGTVTGGAYHPSLPPSMKQVLVDDSSHTASAQVRIHPSSRATRELDQIVDGFFRLEFEVKPRS
ncbi:MAG: SpoIVB peptidase S55 domain-containing protein [Thermoanaerobaculia bacterium]